MSGKNDTTGPPTAPPKTKTAGDQPKKYDKRDTVNTVDRAGNKLEDNDSEQINDHLSKMSAADQLQLRINAQCFMMENIDMFKAWMPKGGYTKFLCMEGDPVTLKQRLAARPGLGNFMQLQPAQMALMIPYVDLYLVNTAYAGNQTGGGKVELGKGKYPPKKVLLPGYTSEADIEAIFKHTSARGRGVALKEFYYEAWGGVVGGDSNEAKQQRKVTMKFAAESLGAMSYRAPGFASVMDLAMTPVGTFKDETSKTEVINPNNYAVRAVFGWAIQKQNRGMFSLEQLAAIDSSAESMVLYNSALPKVTMSDDGTVELEIEFLSKIEIKKDARDRNINIFADSDSGDWQTKTTAANKTKLDAENKLKKVLTEVKATLNPEGLAHFGLNGNEIDIGNNVLDKFGGTGAFEDESYGDAQTKNGNIDHAGHTDEEFLKDDAFKSAGDTSDEGKKARRAAHRKLAHKAREAVKNYRDANAKSQTLQAGNRHTKWSAPLLHLMANQKIHTVYVEKEALGITIEYGTMYDTVKFTKRPKVPPYDANDPAVKKLTEKQRKEWQEAHNAAYKTHQKDREGVRKPVSAGSQASRDAVDSYINHLNAIAEQAKARAKGDEEAREKAAEAVTAAKHTTGYLPVDPSGKYVKLHYIYLGDIIDWALMAAFYRSPKQEPNPQEALFMVGDIQFRDFYRPSRINNTNLGDIPIGLELYKDWLIKNVVGPQVDHMDLKEFLNRLLMDLIVPAFGQGAKGCASSAGDLYGPARQDNALTYEAFEARSNKKNQCRVRQAAKKSGRVRVDKVPTMRPPKINLDARFQEAYAGHFNYVVVHASAIAGTELSENKDIDEKRHGIYHVPMGAEYGPVLETTFEALDDETYESIIVQKDRKYYEEVGFGSSGISRRPQKSVIKMLGNNLFELGRKFYIDISNVGSKDDWQIARALGFGGYYQNIKTFGTIDEKGWLMTVEGYPTQEESKGFNAARKKFLDSRKGLFVDVDKDPDYIAYKNKAIEEMARAKEKEEEAAAQKAKEEKAKVRHSTTTIPIGPGKM